MIITDLRKREKRMPHPTKNEKWKGTETSSYTRNSNYYWQNIYFTCENIIIKWNVRTYCTTEWCRLFLLVDSLQRICMYHNHRPIHWISLVSYAFYTMVCRRLCLLCVCQMLFFGSKKICVQFEMQPLHVEV